MLKWMKENGVFKIRSDWIKWPMWPSLETLWGLTYWPLCHSYFLWGVTWSQMKEKQDKERSWALQYYLKYSTFSESTWLEAPVSRLDETIPPPVLVKWPSWWTRFPTHKLSRMLPDRSHSRHHIAAAAPYMIFCRLTERSSTSVYT